MIDDAKIRNVHALQHNAVVDFLVLLVICGLLFAITILSGSSPKNEEASDYNARSIETISMAFEDDPSSFWYSRSASSGLTSCFHSCDNLAGRWSRRDIVPEVQDISRRQSISKRRITPRSITANCIARPSRSQHSQQKTSRNSNSRTGPREWLVRRTRSGHVYGKYPM